MIEKGPVPAAFTAAIVNVYERPVMSPFTCCCVAGLLYVRVGCAVDERYGVIL